jgi:DNA polymerase III subunit alpha
LYSLHTHDDYSNASLSFADSSMKLSEMIKRGKEIGLKGICLTNHETTSNFVKISQAQKDNPDFKIISGNEIYLLTEKQLELAKENYDSSTMSFFHFILIATNKQGNDMLKQLSTIAWENNSFVAKGLMRRPTTFENLKQVIGDNKGCLIGSTACLGSYIGKKSLEILRNPDKKTELMKHLKIYIKMLTDIFGEGNLYLEMQPPFDKETSHEQVFMNEIILELSNLYDIPYIFTSDAHYLKKEDLKLHSAFLNSKETDDREVSSFYRTAYLMGETEMRNYFKPFLTTEQIDFGLKNTDVIGDRCEVYDLFHTQVIPKIQLDNNWEVDKSFFPNLEYTQKTLNSPHEQDRYLMYKIQQGMIKLINDEDYKETFQRIEQELTEFWEVSIKLNDRLHGYFIAMSKIIDLIWTEGNSLVGVGRGSAGASIIVYLLEITSLNPLKQVVSLPFYRFVDRSKIALADIDIDLEPLKKQKIYTALSNYFESLGGEMVLCATFGTLASRSALATAGRGLGINNDIMDSITGLIPSERGQLYSLSDCLYGNEEKHRKPVPRFTELISEYDGLLETALKIEGLIISRGLHASGVFCTSEPIVKYSAKMRSPKGLVCTQFDLHDSEEAGLIKYDLLFTSASSKIRNTLDTLIEYNYIEQKNTLKETYLNILDPVKLDYDKPKIWESIANNEVVDLFQFNTPVAMNAVSKIKPKSLIELTQANSLMRLQQQEDATESPVETYVRFKNNIKEWYAELDTWKVPTKDQKILEKVLLIYNGVADTQECLMELVQIKNLTGFTIAEADLLRKAIGKKSAKVMEQVKNLFYLKGSENNISNYTLDYIWNVQIMRQAGLKSSPLTQ